MLSRTSGIPRWAAVFALLLAPGTLPPARGDDGALLPPLEQPARLTSSFGEYRSGHYHGGLDLSTEGRIGMPVHAPGPGWAYRVRASGVGYGRCLYFRLDDGRTVVLGHLSRFAEPVESFVASAQDAAGTYEVDLYPPPDSLRFARGDVIAYTGDTGAGPPHLHVEVRVGASADVAVNPLGQGWKVEDTVAPEMTRLRVEPAAAGGLVDGDRSAAVVPLPAGAPARFTVTGPVRLWVETLDHATQGGNQIATYRLSATLDDQPLAEVVLDRFDWRWPDEVELTFLEPLARTRDERWVALDMPPGVRQGVWRRSGAGVSWDRLAPGEHRLTLIAGDFAGNETRREATVILDPDAVLRSAGAKVTARSRGDVFELALPGAFTEIRVEERGPDGEAGTGDWVTLRAPDGVVLTRRGAARAGSWSFVARDGDAVLAEAAPFRAGGEDAVLRYQELAAVVPASAVYGELWIVPSRGRGAADPGSLEPELAGVGPAYRLEPWGTPLRDRVEVELALPAGASVAGVGIYSRAGDRWRFEGAEPTAAGFRTGIRNLEEIALFRDTVPPSVSIPAIGAIGPRPRLEAVIADSGSGVTTGTVGLTLDGIALIAEWDPEAARLRAHLRGDLEPGLHVLQADARDRAGNTASARAEFTVP